LDKDKKSPLPKALIPVIAFFGFAAIIFLSNRPAVAPNGIEMITNTETYETRSDQALEWSREPLAKFDRGEELTEVDKENLNKALKNYEAMGLFQPTAVEPAFQAGRIHFALDDPERAELVLNQAVLNGDGIMQKPDTVKGSTVWEATRLTIAEARYVRSLVFAQLGDYKKALFDANYAVNEVPSSPNYLSARASSYVQLGDIPNAIRDVKAALRLDPDHARSQQLAKLIDSIDPPKGSKANQSIQGQTSKN
jgi:tetratricopeptide (TPR) repeat protein